MPEEYDIKIELDGYWSWQKKLKISPGASTFAENINLIKKDLPFLLLTEELKEPALSPDKNKIAALSNGEIILLDLKNNGSEKTPIATTTEISELSWSSDSKKLIADNIVYEENLSKKTNLNDFIKVEASKFKWGGDQLYYRDKNNIYNFDLVNKQSKKIIKSQEFDNYLIKEDSAFLIGPVQNQSTVLNIFKISTNQLIRSIKLPALSEYDFINQDSRLLNIYDKTHEILYLIDPTATALLRLETINNIKYTAWVDENKLLYANDFEIWLADVSSGNKTLLTRISEKINNVFWHPSNDFIIYATNQSINTLELDERDKRNTIELIRLEDISSSLLNSTGDIIYFSGKMGSQEGLYSLSI